MNTPRVLVCIPTFNENENISDLIKAIFVLQIPRLEVLIVDDDSPDQTPETVLSLKSSYPGLRLLKRGPPHGRGAAGKAAFLYALAEGFDAAIEMDADFSHDPAYLPMMIEGLKAADLVIGSRLILGGEDTDRIMARRLLTQSANLYARLLLRLPVKDANSGYRAWSRKALESIRPKTLKAQGPAIVHETLYRAARAPLSILEIPIKFIDRRKGRSKLNLGKLLRGYLWIIRLALL